MNVLVHVYVLAYSHELMEGVFNNAIKFIPKGSTTDDASKHDEMSLGRVACMI